MNTRRLLLGTLALAACDKLGGFHSFEQAQGGASASAGGNVTAGQGGGTSRAGGSASSGGGLSGTTGGATSHGGSGHGGNGGSSAGGTVSSVGGAVNDLGGAGTSEGGAPIDGVGGALTRGGTAGAGVGGKSANGGSSSGGKGSGGSASGGAGVLPDWTQQFDALYLFEGVGPQLGADASGHGHDLSSVGTPVHSAQHAQGSWSAALTNDDTLTQYFRSSDSIFRTPAGTSFTAGAWFRSDDTTSEFYLLFNGDEASGGFAMRIYTPDGAFRCVVSATGEDYIQETRESIANFSTWTHLACRYDDTKKQVQLFVNGVPLEPPADQTKGISQGTGSFILGQGVTGQFDEVFFVRRALDNYQIARIWGCGVDGSLCTCSSSNPALFTGCGRFQLPCDMAPFSDCSSTLAP